MADNFAAQVAAEVKAYEGALEEIFLASVQDLIQLAQSTSPRDTGFLRNSLQASATAQPQIDPTAQPVKGRSYPPAEIGIEIISGGYGAVLHVGYTAAYSMRLHFGFEGTDSLGREYHQAGTQWVLLAAQQWQEIVAKNEARILSALRAA